MNHIHCDISGLSIYHFNPFDIGKSTSSIVPFINVPQQCGARLVGIVHDPATLQLHIMHL